MGDTMVLKAAAGFFLAIEGLAVLSFSFGLFNLHSLAQFPRGALSAFTRWWRKPTVHPALPAPIEPPPAIIEALPSAAPVLPEKSVGEDQPAECGTPGSNLGTEVSFTFINALAEDSSASGGSELAAVEEESGEAVDSEEDDFVSAELVFEPSSSGMPGIRMMSRGISGLAVRTEPAHKEPQDPPLLVATYQARFVEIENGQVKMADAGDRAYMSEPLAVAAHSPRRTASRATLGPCTSVLSPGASSAAL